MAYVPVSIGIPAVVMRKGSHVVNMVDEGRLQLVRRIPYVVVFLALVIANLTYVGVGPFVGLRNGLGYAMIADGTGLILAFSILLIGRRKWVEKERMAESHVVFLPEWTYAILLCILAGLVIPLALSRLA